MLTSFIEQMLTFPTIIYTGLLALMLIYWLFVMFGALDLDFLGAKLDGMAEAASGKLDAMGDIAQGKLDGMAEAASAKLDGMADAAAAKVEGAVEALDAAHQGLSLLTIFSWLGIGKVPITITLTLIGLVGWVTCMLGMRWLTPVLDPHLPHWITSSLVFLVAMVASVPVTRISTKPMERFFVTHEASRRRDLVGRNCRISTGHVDERFGQATVEEGADAFVIQVRAEPEQKLERGQDALIVAYDPALEAYRVEGLTKSEREMLAKDPTV